MGPDLRTPLNLCGGNHNPSQYVSQTMLQMVYEYEGVESFE